MTRRDRQAKLIENAEDLAAADPAVTRHGGYRTIDDARQSFDRIVSMRRFQRTYPRYTEMVARRRARVPEVWHMESTTEYVSGWTHGRWRLKLPTWILGVKLFSLHEFAHCVSVGEYGHHIPHHGKRFASTYLDMTVMGLDAAARDVLLIHYQRFAVDH